VQGQPIVGVRPAARLRQLVFSRLGMDQPDRLGTRPKHRFSVFVPRNRV